MTVPSDVRKLLNLCSGDNVVFEQNDSGEIVICNASAYALAKAQKAFEGVAELLGIKDENNVQALVDEVRYGRLRCLLTQIYYFRLCCSRVLCLLGLY